MKKFYPYAFLGRCMNFWDAILKPFIRMKSGIDNSFEKSAEVQKELMSRGIDCESLNHVSGIW